MASVRELKTKWQLRFYDAKREPKRTTNSVRKSEYPTRAQAEKEAEWRSQLYDRGEYDPWVQDHPDDTAGQDTVTVGEAVQAYVEDKARAGRRGERRGWGDTTLRNQRPILEDFASRVGHNRLLEHLTPQDLRAFIYREDLSGASKRAYHALLSAWARWLEKRDLPVPALPGEVETTQTIPAWCSREQLTTIIRAFRHVCRADAERNDDPSVTFPEGTRWWMQAAWRFAFWQGLRRGEIVAIRCGGIDLEARRMIVGDESFVPKGKREDVIPLSEPAAQIAADWNVAQRPSKGRLFKHAGAKKVSKAFTEARRQAAGQIQVAKSEDTEGERQLDLPAEARLEGGEDLTLHSLRHGRAIDLIKQRRHVVYVSQFLRHSSLDVTRSYLQVVPRHLHDEIRGLDEEGLDL